MGEPGFREKLKTAVLERNSFFGRADTNCFRIFNAEGDGIDGLTIDYYNGHLLVQYFNREVENNIFGYLSVVGSASDYLPFSVKSILLKNRKSVRGNQNYDEIRDSKIVEGEYPDGPLVVKQNNVKVSVDLVHGQSTGIFMDMFEVRRDLADLYSTGEIKSMLNLFSYTGLFSVHAILKGVGSSINVDLSKGVLKRARENYKINELDVDERDFVYGDALEWVKIFKKKGRTFDFVVFDPPTFARNRKKKFSVKRDYPSALRNISEITGEEGYVLSSVNSYSITRDEYMKFHPESWEFVRFWTESSDFKSNDNPYLKVGLWKPNGNRK